MTVCLQRNANARPVCLPLAARLLDGDSLRLVRRDLGRLVGEPPRRDLHLDLSGVGAPTAAGLAGLVDLGRRLREAGHRLVLLNAGPPAREVLRVTGLDALLELRAD
jgi:anti-anti-sigma regulatory factor